MPEQRAVLRVGSFGERRAAEVSNFLHVIEESHNGFLMFLNLFDEGFRPSPYASARTDPRQAAMYLSKTRGIPDDMRYVLLGDEEELFVTKIAVSSPGIWEFLGALNPLIAINTYLEGRHERRKDREYRETSDRQRLSLENERIALENQLLKTKVVQERLHLAEASRLRPADQRLLLDRLVIEPMLGLAATAEQGMAFAASAVPKIESSPLEGTLMWRGVAVPEPPSAPPTSPVIINPPFGPPLNPEETSPDPPPPSW